MDGAINLIYPFAGRWRARNSPADRVPSHGTELFAAALAIDFVPIDQQGRTAPFSLESLVRPEPPDRFPGFGRRILAPAAGVVVAACSTAPDHRAYRGFPSVGYAVTQRRRLAAGWASLAGNHVMIRAGDVVVALCHLQHDSIRVHEGQHVQAGDQVGLCGNSGNSTEPHVHVQAMDGDDPQRARPVAITFQGSLPRNGGIVDTGGR